MRLYEVALVFHPDLEMDLAQTHTKIEKIFSQFNAKVEKKDNWGKKKLAYTINKQSWGIYTFYELRIDPSNVRKLNDRLRITEEVMRFLIVSLEDIHYLKKNIAKSETTKSVAKSKVEEKK